MRLVREGEDLGPSINSVIQKPTLSVGDRGAKLLGLISIRIRLSGCPEMVNYMGVMERCGDEMCKWSID